MSFERIAPYLHLSHTRGAFGEVLAALLHVGVYRKVLEYQAAYMTYTYTPNRVSLVN